MFFQQSGFVRQVGVDACLWLLHPIIPSPSWQPPKRPGLTGAIKIFSRLPNSLPRLRSLCLLPCCNTHLHPPQQTKFRFFWHRTKREIAGAIDIFASSKLARSSSGPYHEQYLSLWRLQETPNRKFLPLTSHFTQNQVAFTDSSVTDPPPTRMTPVV